MGRSTRRVLVAIAILAAHAAPLDARADAGLRVTREDPAADCPAEAELQHLATQALGSTAASPAHSYRISFARTGASYQAEIVDETARRTRRLEDVRTECAPLGRAVAVALAMMWGTEEEDAGTAGTAGGAPEPPPPAQAPVAAARESSAAPPVPSRWVFALGAAGAFALVRTAAPALLADGAFEYGRFSVALGAFWIAPQRLELDPGFVNVRLLAGTARGCAFAFRVVRVGACARLFAGTLQARGEGYDADAGRVRPWFALGLEAFVDGPLLSPWIGYRAAAGAVVPLHAQVFSIENVGPAYDTPPVGVLLTFAIQFATRGLTRASAP